MNKIVFNQSNSINVCVFFIQAEAQLKRYVVK